MMKWHFVRQRPDATTRDPIVGEFFSTDATPNPAQALVREGIQNALDAGKGKPINIRIFRGCLQDFKRIEYWFGGAWEHYLAPKNGLSDVPQRDEEMQFLVFEDFETYGLQGDVEQAFDEPGVKNSFYYFFRAEGRSGKSEQDRGRWGVGKYVFPRASRISSFLALTVRANDKKHFLMGRSILKSRKVNGINYTPDGYFGINTTDDKPTLPTGDEKIISQLCKDFNLKRKNESGLSVVVPFVETDNSMDNIQWAVLRDYFYPILKGDLVVTIEADGRSTTIDSSTLFDLAKTVDMDSFSSMLNLARWSLSDEKTIFELLPCKDKRPVWSTDLIPSDILPLIKNKYDMGEYIAVRAYLSIRHKNDVDTRTFFDIYLVQEKNEDGRPVFVREGIIVSDVKPKRTRGVLALVVIDDKPLAALLGDSENPAHTQWQSDSSNFRNKYTYGKSYIDFVTNIVSNIVSALSAKENELDASLVLDFFSLPADDEMTKKEVKNRDKKPGKKADVPDISAKPREKNFVLQQIPGGFYVKSNGSQLSYPAKLEIHVAYDVRKGNPLNKYDISDFRLEQAPIRIKKPTKGLTLERVNSNVLVADIIKDDFEVLLTGFDQNRDLYVKVKMTEGKDDPTI